MLSDVSISASSQSVQVQFTKQDQHDLSVSYSSIILLMAPEIFFGILPHQYRDGSGQNKIISFVFIPGIPLLRWP